MNCIGKVLRKVYTYNTMLLHLEILVLPGCTFPEKYYIYDTEHNNQTNVKSVVLYFYAW